MAKKNGKNFFAFVHSGDKVVETKAGSFANGAVIPYGALGGICVWVLLIKFS